MLLGYSEDFEGEGAERPSLHIMFFIIGLRPYDCRQHARQGERSLASLVPSRQEFGEGALLQTYFD